MTVGELKAMLNSCDDGDLVVLQKDSEGNGHSPLSGMWKASYREITTWSGDCGLRELTPDDISFGYGEEDVIDGVPALVLYPVN